MLLSQGHANSRVMHVERTHTSSTVAVISVSHQTLVELTKRQDLSTGPTYRCDILLQVAVAIGAAKAKTLS